VSLQSGGLTLPARQDPRVVRDKFEFGVDELLRSLLFDREENGPRVTVTDPAPSESLSDSFLDDRILGPDRVVDRVLERDTRVAIPLGAELAERLELNGAPVSVVRVEVLLTNRLEDADENRACDRYQRPDGVLDGAGLAFFPDLHLNRKLAASDPTCNQVRGRASAIC
jgi:hypothetical protein